MRLTVSRASGVFAMVTVSTPFLKFAVAELGSSPGGNGTTRSITPKLRSRRR
jgi:hypothetical protein